VGLGLENSQDVLFLHNEVVLTIHGNFGAGPLAVQYLVAYFHLGLDNGAGIRRFAIANGYYLATLGRIWWWLRRRRP
jgi:hypothetical protein